MANIKVIDNIMGCGKSTHITNYMLENRHLKFLYVTPLLSEARDVMPAKCSLINMRTPLKVDASVSTTTKSSHLLELLQAGENISTTHSLFKSLTKKHIEEIATQGYILILDEVVDYITPYNSYSTGDITDLFARGDLVSDKGNLGKVTMSWEVSQTNHYKDLHNVCEASMLYATSKPENLLNIQIPTTMLDAAKEVIILTYMFKASTMSAFLKLHKYEVEYLKIPELIAREKEVKNSLKARIELIEIKAADKFLSSFRDTSLSYNWWERAIEQGYAVDFIKYISNWLRNNNEYSNSFYFCLPKEIITSTSKRKSLLEKNKIQYFSNTDEYTDDSGRVIDKLTDELVQGMNQVDSISLDVSVFPPKYIPSGTKATNLYRKRNLCICLSNIYANVNIQHYLSNYAEKVDEDSFALAEVLQFIFRGCVRVNDNSKLSVYLASPRMKKLVKEWLDS